MDWEPDKLANEVGVFSGETREPNQDKSRIARLSMFGLLFISAVLFLLCVWLVVTYFRYGKFQWIFPRKFRYPRDGEIWEAVAPGEELNELDERDELDESSDLEPGDWNEDTSLLKRGEQ